VKRALLLIVSAAFLAGLAGCAHGPYEATTYGPGRTSLEQTEKVIFADQELRRKMRLVDLKSLRNEDDRLEVYAELENRTSKNLVVQVMAQFRDAAGRLSADETNWRTIVMAPHSSTAYRAVSMNEEAQDFVVRVKLEERH